MEREFKAFISYRHLPLEMAVARKLHRRIEHYVIPKALRRDGKKKLGYVFRDQDELPLSSHLSSDIETALDHSEFLIVICSPETKKSLWVMREITYFLEKHDRDHVLVMIAAGSSEEAIPAPLTDYLAEDGRLVARVEPLAAKIAADSSFRRNRLFAVESLRLLAAMIGCSFDELYKREQRYRLRRVGAAVAAAAVIAGVFIATLLDRNREIRENYEQALRNQSHYLASESLKALDDGDRLRAISLAIEALPGEGKERPHVSEAEYALGCAVGAYLSPGEAIGLHAVGMLSHMNVVREFRINDSGTLLCSFTDGGVLVGWDLRSMKKLWTFSSDVTGLAGFRNDSELVAWSETELYCLDALSGERKWSVPVSALSASSVASLRRVCLAEDSRDIVAGCFDSFSVLDGESGAILRSFPWPETTGDGAALELYEFSFQLSPDGRLLAAQCESGSALDGVAVLDLLDGSIRALKLFEGEYYFPDSYAFDGEGRFYFLTEDLSSGSALTFLSSKTMIRSESCLHCVDLVSGELLWESRHSSCSTAANDRLYYDTTLTGEPIVLYAYANHLDVLAADSGALLAQTEFSSRLVGLDVFSRRIVCVTEMGERGTVSPDDFSRWYSSQSFVGDLIFGKCRPGGAWILPRRSNDIVCYGAVEADPSWVELETLWAEPKSERTFYEDDFLIEPGCIAFLDEQRLLLGDGDPAHPLRELRLENDPNAFGGTRYRFDSYCDGALCMVWTDSGGGVLYVDPATGDCRRVPWTDEEEQLIGICGTDEGRRWVGIGYRKEESEGELRQTFLVHTLNEALVPEKTVELGALSGIRDWAGRYDPSGRLYLYFPDVDKGFCADLADSTLTECGEELCRAFAAVLEHGGKLNRKTAFSADGSLLAVELDPGEYRVFGAEGRALYSIRSESPRILAVSFTPDGRWLLSVESDGFLRRYRASDGALLSRNDLAHYHSLNDSAEISFRYTGSGFLALRVDSYMNLISTEDWGVFAYVPGCFAYLEDRDFFVCYDYPGSERVYSGFPRYSLESLIARGRSILNGWEMSEILRMQYGLD